MQYSSFSTEADDRIRIGTRHGDALLDVTDAYAARLRREGHSDPAWRAERLQPRDMVAYLRLGEVAKAHTEDTVEYFADAIESGAVLQEPFAYDSDAVTLRSPLPRPNSLRDCSVYEEHLLNTRDLEPGSLDDSYYEAPIYYNGNPDAMAAPDSVVQWPSFSEQLDFELEIAAVIGESGRDIALEDAHDHIFGYTILNDFSARDLQARVKPLKVGPSKSKDFANGLGPYLVTEDDIDITDCSTEARIDGEVWSESATAGMEHSWAEIVHYLSLDVELKAGDVIGSGTVPMGCGLEMDRWVEVGDTIELTVEDIGTLRHTLERDGTR